MEKININGKDFTLEELNNLIEESKKRNPMKEVFAFHKITEEEFNEQYKNVSKFAKNQEIERMIVNFYNRGVECDWDNKSQRKYYPYFYLGKNFSYDGFDGCTTNANVGARLCFLRLEDLQDAVVKFLPQYTNSRNYEQ